MSSITNSGFVLTDLQAVQDTLVNSLTAVYGTGWDLSLDSFDGQLVIILSTLYHDQDELAQQVYNSFRPDYAAGNQLDTLVALNGVYRKPGIQTNGAVTFTGVSGTVVPSGTIVYIENTDYYFSTTTDVAIGSTTSVTVDVKCTVDGDIAVSAGQINKIKSPLLGVTSVTNTSALVTGRAPESDNELRARRSESVATPARSILGAIYSALNSINSVITAKVYEYSNLRAVRAVVYGGGDLEIATALWKYKSVGTYYLGAISYYITDEQGFLQQINFDRADIVQVLVNVTLRRNQTSLSNSNITSSVVAGLVAFGSTLKIEQTVSYWDVGLAINKILEDNLSNAADVVNLSIGRINPLGSADIPLTEKEIGRIIAGNVTVSFV